MSILVSVKEDIIKLEIIYFMNDLYFTLNTNTIIFYDKLSENNIYYNIKIHKNGS